VKNQIGNSQLTIESLRCYKPREIERLSLRFTGLSHSETVGDAVWEGRLTGCTLSTPARRQPAPEGGWPPAPAIPGGMKLAERQGQTPV